MEVSTVCGLTTELYEEQKQRVWPKSGRHILAHYDDASIVVYQAFCPEIAEYAVKNGSFGGSKYSFTRMTWIKTNFLWMMYRAGWATKKNQERILALFLKREGFDEILRSAREGKAPPGTNDHGEGPDEVRLQWDPDHHPSGSKLERRAVQLGLRGRILVRFNQEWLLRIEDITNFVKTQHAVFTEGSVEKLVTPREREYIPIDAEICRHIRLNGFSDQEETGSRENGAWSGPMKKQHVESSGEGACCAGMLDCKIGSAHGLNESVATEGLPGTGNVKEESCDVIICLGGAFNPVHTRHIQCMVESKKWLEENTKYRVIAGVLAVAPDGFVRSKCRKTGQKCIKPEHRIKLCELACREFCWLKPYQKPTGSAKQGGHAFLRDSGMKNVQLVVLVGADRAINAAGKAKWHSDIGAITVCIGREGETATVREAFERDVEDGRVRKEPFYIMPTELDSVSSTEIRKRLCFDGASREDKESRVHEIVELGWLHHDVAQYIVQHEADLYTK